MSSNNNIYVIMGCGRTGSNHLRTIMANPMDDRDDSDINVAGGVCSALATTYDNSYQLARALSKCSNVVIHTHNKNIVTDLNLDPTDMTLVISKRYDLYTQCMSFLTAATTNEWHMYTNKVPEPVEIPVSRFNFVLNSMRVWYDDINFSLPYKKVATLYYEDVISQGYPLVKTTLGITDEAASPSAYTFPSSPHNYKDWITNWQELRNVYLLSSQP